MKRYLSLALALIMVLALTACGSKSDPSATDSDSKSTEKVVLKYSELNSEQTSQYRWDVKFKELVEEKTNGSVEIDIYTNGQLSSQDPEAVTNGICDILMCVPSNWSDYYSEIAAVDAPYAITSAEEGIKVFATPDSPVLARANEALKDSSVIWLSAYYEGSREMTTTDTPVSTLADLKPLKMRVVNSDLYIQLFKAFGCEATPMAWSEVASGLITGVIDGQENPADVPYSSSFYEVQKYISATNHIAEAWVVGMNPDKFASLDEDLQTLIAETAQEMQQWKLDYDNATDQADIDFMVEKGMEYNELDEAGFAAFQEVSKSLYPEFQKIVDNDDLWNSTIEFAANH